MSESNFQPRANKNHLETEIPESNYDLLRNQNFLDFQKVSVTERDESKPWKPALKVDVTQADGETVSGLDATAPFFLIRDKKGNEITISAATAGHIDDLHIKGLDAGSKFDYNSVEDVITDVAEKLPSDVAETPGVTAMSLEMGKSMGNEGIAAMSELVADGVLTETDIALAQQQRAQVDALNRDTSATGAGAREEFVKQFRENNPSAKIQFQVIRGNLIAPIVDAPKRPTTQLFVVFGPGADGKKTMYTAAPGRDMPKHPIPGQHMSPEGVLDEVSFQKSADAWFDTVMLTGK